MVSSQGQPPPKDNTPHEEFFTAGSIETVPLPASSGVGKAPEDLLVKRIQIWNEVQSIRPAWEQLVSESQAKTIFLSWEWLRSWWAAYGRSLELYFLGCFDCAGRLVGIAPLYRTRWPLRLPVQVWMLRLLGDGSGDSEGLDWIVHKSYEVAAVRAWLDWLDRRRSEWDILELNTLPAESPVAQILQEEFRQRGWRYWQRANPHLVLVLPDSWESYLGSLSKKRRYSVLSSIRGIEKQFRVCLERCKTQTELPRFLDRLFDLHSKRCKAKGEQGAFQWPARRSFFAEMASRFLACGWLDFWLLSLNGQVVAAEFGFCYNNVYSYLQGGFDPAYSACRVGIASQALILQELIRRGVRCYDFLSGGELYKTQLGAQRRVYYHLRCARPHTRGAFYATLAVVLEAGKRWARVWLPKPFWRSLHWIYLRLRPPSSLDEIAE